VGPCHGSQHPEWYTKCNYGDGTVLRYGKCDECQYIDEVLGEEPKKREFGGPEIDHRSENVAPGYF